MKKELNLIPSESVCYPAKLSHGHIESLIEKELNIFSILQLLMKEKKMLLKEIITTVQS